MHIDTKQESKMNYDIEFEKHFKNSPLATAICSVGKGCIYFNAAMQNLFQCKSEELKIKHFNSFTHPDDNNKEADLFKDFTEGKIDSFQIEKRFVKKNDEIFYALVSVSAIKRSKNEFIAMTQIQDISDRVRAEKEFIASNERYKRAIVGSEIGLWDWDTESDEIYWSPKINEITGYSERDKIHFLKNLESLVHPDDREYREQSYKNHIEEKKPFNIEYRIKHKEGHHIWLHSKAESIRDAEGRVVKMFGSVEDISRKKEAELKLEEASERYQLVLAATQDGIWDWPDTSKNSQYWSPRLYELLGYKDKEIESSVESFHKLLHPDDAEMYKRAKQKHMKNNKPFDLEYRLKTKSGEYKWFLGKGIVTVKNNITRMTGSLTDINSKRENEDKIRDYTSELERINEDLDSFAYITSHDLKEPLRGIFNNVLFLSEDYQEKIDENGRKRFLRIMSLCEKMGKLIDDILAYSKLKNKELVIKKIDLNKVIEDIEVTLENKISESNAEIIIPKKLPSTICDEVTITEALRNLISNGIKYNQSKKKIIEIGYEKKPDEKGNPKYIFYVKDNGIGVDEKFFDIIFAPFKRLDNIDQIIEGSGIGLHFVQRIIQRHGGQIWLESAIGKGSTFFFTLS